MAKTISTSLKRKNFAKFFYGFEKVDIFFDTKMSACPHLLTLWRLTNTLCFQNLYPFKSEYPRDL